MGTLYLGRNGGSNRRGIGRSHGLKSVESLDRCSKCTSEREPVTGVIWALNMMWKKVQMSIGEMWKMSGRCLQGTLPSQSGDTGGRLSQRVVWREVLDMLWCYCY